MDTDVQTTARTETLRALLDFIDTHRLNSPSGIHLYHYPDRRSILVLTLPSRLDARRWCEAFDIEWEASANEVSNVSNHEWLGWTLAIRSHSK